VSGRKILHPRPLFGIVLGKRFFGISTMTDRVATHYLISLNPALQICVLLHPAMWASSAYLFGKRIWLRPINYRAVDEFKAPQS